jgi:thiamine monophosphate synthase
MLVSIVNNNRCRRRTKTASWTDYYSTRRPPQRRVVGGVLVTPSSSSSTQPPRLVSPSLLNLHLLLLLLLVQMLFRTNHHGIIPIYECFGWVQHHHPQHRRRHQQEQQQYRNPPKRSYSSSLLSLSSTSPSSSSSSLDRNNIVQRQQPIQLGRYNTWRKPNIFQRVMEYIDDDDDDDDENNHDGPKEQSSEATITTTPSSPPRPMGLLAVITEPDACETESKMEDTYNAIVKAVSSTKVDLICIRLNKQQQQQLQSPPPPLPTTTKMTSLTSSTSTSTTPTNSDICNTIDQQQQQVGADVGDNDNAFITRACTLTKRLMDLSKDGTNFKLMCSSDWIDVALRCTVHGIHVKEKHLQMIPSLYTTFPYPIIIGTSTHSIISAIESYSRYQPHYYFVGTCYFTSSHPEKTCVNDLEGPTLPGQVKYALQEYIHEQQQQFLIETPTTMAMPWVFAIGGIQEHNCHIPVQYGADGVAVIRAVLQAHDPCSTVQQIHTNMGAAER